MTFRHPLRRDMRCMVEVLQKMANVDQVESGVLNRDGWVQPFVQYRYREQDGALGTVQFVAQNSKNSKSTISFLALLNGLSTPGGPDPPDFGAGEIARQWELQCGVTAVAIYV
jgi:hypothetical protein